MRRPAVSRELPPLGLLVFVVGSASLGGEIAAARLLAPFFGASTIVWANTIGVVLASLSLGYWFGGRFADRHPHRRGLCTLVLLAALAVGLVPFAADPFLNIAVDALDSVSAGAFVGSLAAVLVLVAPPMVLLGAASPYAIRLAVERVEESGTVAGRMYAISTAGSLLGTFVSALVLIPLVGTRRTFLILALACAAVAVAGVPRKRGVLVPVTLVALLALPIGTIKAAEQGRVLAEVETRYHTPGSLRSPMATVNSSSTRVARFIRCIGPAPI
jgi:MFS family permease